MDFVVVPGMAFDKRCRRLGRGKGFYDRLFGGDRPRAFLCGLAFEMQVFDEVPAGPADVPLDAIVTEKSLYMLKRIAILGAGRMGRTVGYLLGKKGYEVVAVYNRTPARAEESVRFIGHCAPETAPEAASRVADVVLITTIDAAIEPTCRQVSALSGIPAGSVVIHMSGSLPSSVLSSARECGAAVGSMHPLQTVPAATTDENIFRNAAFVHEGDEAAAPVIVALVQALGGIPIRIEPSRKALYHAASVMACNYLVALLHAALDMYVAAGVSRQDALAGVMPIVETTCANVKQKGAAGALTGPIARGDVETVVRNMEAVAEHVPHLQGAFSALGRVTVQLARNEGFITDTQALAMENILMSRKR